MKSLGVNFLAGSPSTLVTGGKPVRQNEEIGGVFLLATTRNALLLTSIMYLDTVQATVGVSG